MKTCCTCKINKNDSDFYKNGLEKDGMARMCIECHKKSGAIHREGHREELREKWNVWYQIPENKLKSSIYHKEHFQKI